MLPREKSPVYWQDVPRNKGGGIRAQPHHRPRDLFRCPKATHRMQRDQLWFKFWSVEPASLGHRGVNHSRGDCIDAQTLIGDSTAAL